jgi:hypothetical protein
MAPHGMKNKNNSGISFTKFRGGYGILCDRERPGVEISTLIPM